MLDLNFDSPGGPAAPKNGPPAPRIGPPAYIPPAPKNGPPAYIPPPPAPRNGPPAYIPPPPAHAASFDPPRRFVKTTMIILDLILLGMKILEQTFKTVPLVEEVMLE